MHLLLIAAPRTASTLTKAGVSVRLATSASTFTHCQTERRQTWDHLFDSVATPTTTSICLTYVFFITQLLLRLSRYGPLMLINIRQFFCTASAFVGLYRGEERALDLRVGRHRGDCCFPLGFRGVGLVRVRPVLRLVVPVR